MSTLAMTITEMKKKQGIKPLFYPIVVIQKEKQLNPM
jgi:hypothetical protein